jgi:lysophospholipase L1-like esterase
MKIRGRRHAPGAAAKHRGRFAAMSACAMAACLCMFCGVAMSSSWPDIRNVVTFGTSLTARGGWQQPLAHALEKIYGHKVEVSIIAKSGEDSRWGLANVGRVIAAKPDVVLIEFAVNDASLVHLVSKAQSRRNTAMIVARIREKIPAARIFLMSMSPVWGYRFWVRPFLNSYYDQQKELAHDLRVGFIENRGSWSQLSPAELRQAIPDRGHPRPEVATRLIVPHIVAAITAPHP